MTTHHAWLRACMNSCVEDRTNTFIHVCMSYKLDTTDHCSVCDHVSYTPPSFHVRHLLPLHVTSSVAPPRDQLPTNKIRRAQEILASNIYEHQLQMCMQKITWAQPPKVSWVLEIEASTQRTQIQFVCYWGATMGYNWKCF